MNLLVRFNPIHQAITIPTPAKEQEWKIDVGGKWLYQLNTINENDIEVYFRVNYTTIKENTDKKSKLEKVPFEVYIAKLPGFSDVLKEQFHPSIPNIEKYFNICELFNHISTINIKTLNKSNKQYIIKSIMKSEIDKEFECESYLIFTSNGIGLNKNTLKTFKIIRYLKNFLK